MLNTFWVKLSSGESILCQTEGELENLYSDAIVAVMHPMFVQQNRMLVSGNMVETFSLMPWRNYSDDEVFNIVGDHIITAAEPSEKMRRLYEEILTERDDQSQEYDETSDDLDLAQQLIQALQESYDEDDEEDDQEKTRKPRRLFH